MITNQNIPNLNNARPKTVSLIATPYTQAINHYLVKLLHISHVHPLGFTRTV